MVIPSGALAPQSLQLLQGLTAAYGMAGRTLAAFPESSDIVLPMVRERVSELIANAPATLGAPGSKDLLDYPLRTARRLIEGETYGAARFFALERNLLRREGFLRGYRTSFFTETESLPPDTLADGGRTLPSPPVTMSVSRPPSYEECRDAIESAVDLAASLPEELRQVDLTRRPPMEVKSENRSLAGTVVPLPMKTVLDRLFTRSFDIGMNSGNFPGFWAEQVRLTSTLPRPDRPSTRISCVLESDDHLRAFVLAIKTFLNISNPIEIGLEGHFEWRAGALYIPMKPVSLSGAPFPPDAVFGTVTPILVPYGPSRTVFALAMENKMLSQNPSVFVEAMARGMV